MAKDHGVPTVNARTRSKKYVLAKMMYRRDALVHGKLLSQRTELNEPRVNCKMRRCNNAGIEPAESCAFFPDLARSVKPLSKERVWTVRLRFCE